ncbi:GNAT family N-acetyltransferase [Brenneria tiliae]|uniref:GNAT family N-acetyltransferase n=1 Tax=Brenneria tiliae TaxID=2914984 RepID=UPI002014FBBA|nr:GNAT family N-acetyltransferase [Brenneria tiliae]MCL2898083.1 GNAT family N-acetyltransferase [Brenneria tiliae]MCL2902164.1 GNAT family N-acetyltransferase [Brenneria tiliae]
MNVTIRNAEKKDAEIILAMITELAIYEKARHEVVTDQQGIEDRLFAPDSKTEALICEADGVPVGYAVFFTSYSTWLGRNGIYLEDLYVTPDCRGKGMGKTLLRHIARLAAERNCGRLEWSVLDWNQPAIDFYRSIGAAPQHEWIRYRLENETLRAFAGEKN